MGCGMEFHSSLQRLFLSALIQAFSSCILALKRLKANMSGAEQQQIWEQIVALRVLLSPRGCRAGVMPVGISWQLPVPGISLKPPDFLGTGRANTPGQTKVAQRGFEMFLVEQLSSSSCCQWDQCRGLGRWRWVWRWVWGWFGGVDVSLAPS